MIRTKSLLFTSLVLVASACAGPSAEAGHGPSGASPAATAPTATAPAVAASAAAAPTATAPPAPAKVEEVQVICEYVRRSGSNIATRECREVNRFVDDAGKKGAENWFKSGPSSPSR